MRRLVGLSLVGLSLVLLVAACGTTAPKRSGIALENMDRSVRPVDDLYLHVNGTWLKNAKIPSDKSNYGIFTRLADKARDDVRTIIEEAVASPDSPEAQRVAGLYNSYLNTDRINALGMSPLAGELKGIDAISTHRQVAEWFGRAGRLGVKTPVGLYISYDSRQPSRYLVHLTQSGLGLPDRDYYFKEGDKAKALRDAYKKYIATMAGLAMLPDAERTAKVVYSIEIALAKSHWTRTERRDREKTYNKVNASDLPKQGAAFSWAGYLGTSKVSAIDEVILRELTYFPAFVAVFEKTSVGDWKTYARFHLVNSYATEMFAALDEAHFDFYDRTLAGVPEPKPRWERAVQAVNSVLGEAVGKLYVRRHFKPEAKARMVELVENLRAAYAAAITDLAWLGEDTKKQALVKLANFRPKIGYPDKWKDYSGLIIKADDLFGNAMRHSIWKHDYRVGQLTGPVDRDEWFMSPQTVNAYYNPPMNEIVFPAAILQPPFFDLDADDAVNYGAIGGVIGHEMGHGFDDQGSKFDGDGVLRNWWTEDDLKEFKRRTGALVDQAKAYEVIDGEMLNGELTLGENIGDLGGATIAYRAWQRSVDGGAGPLIDGFTGAQRFFMGWAQVWARLYRPAELRRRLTLDPHSPSHFRANMPASNMSEFYEAFGVKPGDKLYRKPAERVKIW
ncbi:MAG: putative endopeptidase [Myxococcota bacterium]|jgi:putative endopeptidase